MRQRIYEFGVLKTLDFDSKNIKEVKLLGKGGQGKVYLVKIDGLKENFVDKK